VPIIDRGAEMSLHGVQNHVNML